MAGSGEADESASQCFLTILVTRAALRVKRGPRRYSGHGQFNSGFWFCLRSGVYYRIVVLRGDQPLAVLPGDDVGNNVSWPRSAW